MKMTSNPVKYEVLLKQYQQAILDISRKNAQKLKDKFLPQTKNEIISTALF